MKNRLVAWLLFVGLVPALTMAQSTLALAQGPFADVPPRHPAEAALDELAKQGLVNGYPDGTYRGNRAMTRYEVAMAAMRIMQAPLRRNPGSRFWPIQPIPGPPLKDVPEGHWAADAVASLRKWGILAGYPDGTFAGDRVMTRSEFALVLKRLHEFIDRLVDLELEQRRKDTPPVLSVPALTAPSEPARPPALTRSGVGRDLSKSEATRGTPPAASPQQSSPDLSRGGSVRQAH
jgi:hypothetical protein